MLNGKKKTCMPAHVGRKFNWGDRSHAVYLLEV